MAKEGNLVLGEEWSDQESFLGVVSEYIIPFIPKIEGCHVLEIGVGGGRVANQVAPFLQ